MSIKALWFAWKLNPKVEHEATRGEVTDDHIAALRAKLDANPDIDHTTLYERTDAGELVKLS